MSLSIMSPPDTNAPPLSVVMSVHNGEQDLHVSIRGILAQSFRDFELVVINDGSTDRTGELLDRYAGADSRVRVIHQENTGLTKALIRGCELARGEFIARHDADDFSLPERFAEQIDLLRSDPAIGFVSCATQYIGPQGEPLNVVSRPTDPVEATNRLLFHREGPTHHGSVMFRRESYREAGGYRSEFYYGQDADLWLRLGELSQIGYLADVRYIAAYRPDSISGGHREVQREFGRWAHECRSARLAGTSEEPILKQAANFRKNRSTTSSSETAASPEAWRGAYLIGSQLRRTGHPHAKRYLWNCIRQKPTHWKAWVKLLFGSKQSATETSEESERGLRLYHQLRQSPEEFLATAGSR